jgi:hypothetical protein
MDTRSRIGCEPSMNCFRWLPEIRWLPETDNQSGIFSYSLCCDYKVSVSYTETDCLTSCAICGMHGLPPKDRVQLTGASLLPAAFFRMQKACASVEVPGLSKLVVSQVSITRPGRH